MNRYVRRAAAAALLAGGLGAAGCASTGGAPHPVEAPVARGVAPDGVVGGGGGYGGGRAEGWSCYYNYVDPCWPERYSAVARAEVLAPFAAQVNNGHVLNQTVWNWYFEPGTDTLTPAGAAKLDSLAQTRPQPDPRLYLQVARDVPVAGAGGLDTIATRRDELTAKRADVVRRYMAAQPSLYPVAYEVYVHDPVVVGMPAEFAARAYRGQALGYVGGLTVGGAAAVTTGGGAAVGGGAVGGAGISGGAVGPGGGVGPAGPGY